MTISRLLDTTATRTAMRATAPAHSLLLSLSETVTSEVSAINVQSRKELGDLVIHVSSPGLKEANAGSPRRGAMHVPNSTRALRISARDACGAGLKTRRSGVNDDFTCLSGVL